jgi:drug/metabolite transporter (DMT)-like permease
MPLREWLLLAFRGFTGYTIGVTLISKAATLTLIGSVSFIAALPFVPLIGFLFLKEKVTWWKVAFITGALLGVSLLSVHDFGNLLSWGRGEIFAVIATLGFAVSYVTRRLHTQYLRNQEITIMTFVLGAIQILILSVILGEGVPDLHISALSWFVIALGGVLNVISLFLSNYAFEHVDTVRAGNLLNLETAWGLLFGLVFYHEWPSLIGLFGGFLIVACVVGMNVFSSRAARSIGPTS